VFAVERDRATEPFELGGEPVRSARRRPQPKQHDAAAGKRRPASEYAYLVSLDRRFLPHVIPPGDHPPMSLPLLFVLVLASVAAAALSIAYALTHR
jgi:hypothetical protein